MCLEEQVKVARMLDPLGSLDGRFTRHVSCSFRNMSTMSKKAMLF